MNRRHRIGQGIAVCLALALFLMTGCASDVKDTASTQYAHPDENMTVIGVSQLGSESMWRSANTASIREAFSKENGYFLMYNNARQKQENQIKAIRSFISQRVDYIIFSPIVEDGWETVLKEAQDANIPVIIMDRNVDCDPSLYTAWIGSDFEEEGRNAGRWLEDDLKGKNFSQSQVNIVILQGTPGSTAMLGRTKGFQTIADAHDNWNILACEDADFTTAKGKEVMEKYLKDTYGITVYQEQVIEIFRRLAGFSLGQADMIRRAMSKKKHDVMAQERKNFIYGVEEDGVVKIDGALRRGVSKEAAEKIFDEMMDFASYAFNKAHAACYAVVAYRTALLKCLYPAEFMTALINSYLTAADRVSFYIYYCRKHGIRILPPDINRSEARFSVENGAVRFGLAAIRNVGEGAMNDVLEERSRGGAFSDFSNFLRRTSDGLNKRLLEGLIKAGCFDCFGVSRKYLTAHFEQEFTAAAAERKRLETGQLSLFDFGGDDGGSMMNTVSEADKADMKTEFELDILLRAEKEVLGVYVSGHPLMEYEAALSALTPCIELAEADGSGAIHDNQTVTAGGIIGSLRTRAAKSGAGLMAYAVLEDMSGSIEIAAFPSIYQKYASLIANDKCVAVRGRFSMREDRDNSILIDEIVPLQKGSKNAGEKRLALNFLSDALHLRNAAVELLHRFPGNTEVLFRDAATGKVLLAPRHCCVNCAEELLFELKRMLGEENVKIVRKK